MLSFMNTIHDLGEILSHKRKVTASIACLGSSIIKMCQTTVILKISTMPFVAVSCVRLSNDRGAKFRMQGERWDNIPPDLCHNSYNSFSNHRKEGDMKVFFSCFPLLCSHQRRPCTPPLDYHRSSFLFCFSLRVPIQSVFISPSVPFTAAFISTRSLNLWQLLFFVNPLSLFTSSLTSSFSLPPPVCHPSPASFNLTCLIFLRLLPAKTFSLCLSQHALTSTLSNVPSLPPVSAKPSMDQLSSLA